MLGLRHSPFMGNITGKWRLQCATSGHIFFLALKNLFHFVAGPTLEVKVSAAIPRSSTNMQDLVERYLKVPLL
jgi:hypothetical protein